MHHNASSEENSESCYETRTRSRFGMAFALIYQEESTIGFARRPPPRDTEGFVTKTEQSIAPKTSPAYAGAGL